jgi:hypothetical protein
LRLGVRETSSTWLTRGAIDFSSRLIAAFCDSRYHCAAGSILNFHSAPSALAAVRATMLVRIRNVIFQTRNARRAPQASTLP